jgi:hypothetical protein
MIQEELSGEIIGAAMDVLNELDRAWMKNSTNAQ